MTSLVARRARNLAILSAAIAAFVVWHGTQAEPTDSPQRFTGWFLFGLVAFLALYNARKKIAVVPLGSSAAWLQWHIYVGLFSVALFFLHTGLHFPTGPLETVLALLFLLTAASGIGGLYITRRIPTRLARRGEEVIYERIPAFIGRLSERAEKLAVESVTTTRSRAIGDFYAARLRSYFDGPHDRWEHVFGLGSSHRRREHDMEEFRACLGPGETPVFDELADLVQQKEDLDYQRANQGLLKHWFFVHIPLTYALIPFALTHVILVYAFGGGR